MTKKSHANSNTYDSNVFIFVLNVHAVPIFLSTSIIPLSPAVKSNIKLPNEKKTERQNFTSSLRSTLVTNLNPKPDQRR